MTAAGFVMVPAWLRRKKPSGNALLVYVNLAAFGTFNPETGTYEECRPSVATLADECGFGERTVQRGLVELYGLGAVERTVKFDPVTRLQLPTVYRVIFGAVVEPGRVSAQTPGGVSPVVPLVSEGDTSVTPGVSLLSPNQEALTKNNINTREARASQPVLGEIVDKASSRVVSSGHTPLEEYQRTVREGVATVMNAWRQWRTERGVLIGASADADAQRQVHELVAELAKNGGDLTEGLRAVWRGLVAWSAESYPAWRIPDFVRKATAPAVASSRAAQAQQQRKESIVTSMLEYAERAGIDLHVGTKAIGGTA